MAAAVQQTHLDDALDVVFVLHVLEDGEDARHTGDGVEGQRVHQVLAVQHARHVVPGIGDSVTSVSDSDSGILHRRQ